VQVLELAEVLPMLVEADPVVFVALIAVLGSVALGFGDFVFAPKSVEPHLRQTNQYLPLGKRGIVFSMTFSYLPHGDFFLIVFTLKR